MLSSTAQKPMIPQESMLHQRASCRRCGLEGSVGSSADAVPWKPQIIWPNVFFIVIIHALALSAFFATSFSPKAALWQFVYGYFAGFGITGGVHRYWTHRSYKAKLPLRIILLFCYSIAGQKTIFNWVRDHRVHHKFSETDADPHNSKRGFFFAHMGWLMQKKHPDVIAKGRQIDMSDILEDRLARVFDENFTMVTILFCFLLPSAVPVYFWGQPWHDAILQVMVRYIIQLHSTWSVNSAAHMWGNHPFDKRLSSAENRAVAIVAMGEGWHNYHHVFPWDYKAAELGDYTFNLTTFYLDLFAKLGWAYDLKHPSPELVARVAQRYGDGSHPQWGNNHVQEAGEEADSSVDALFPDGEAGRST